MLTKSSTRKATINRVFFKKKHISLDDVQMLHTTHWFIWKAVSEVETGKLFYLDSVHFFKNKGIYPCKSLFKKVLGINIFCKRIEKQSWEQFQVLT